MVLQDPLSAVNPRHKVGRAIAEPLRHLTGLSAAERRAQVHALLSLVGLDPSVIARLPSQLSGGQVQRVGLARGLATRPALVVLDEAVSNLDAPLQIEILDRLTVLRRREQGTAFLLVTHDIRLARRSRIGSSFSTTGGSSTRRRVDRGSSFSIRPRASSSTQSSRPSQGCKLMQRITVTLDHELVEAVDRIAEVRCYAGRSEAMRDLLRRGLAEARRERDPDHACVATFSFVAEAGVRDLGQRLAEEQRARHDLVITQVQVPLDHEAARFTPSSCAAGSGKIHAFVDAIATQRGVRHDSLSIIPARIEVVDHPHGHTPHPHEHIRT